MADLLSVWTGLASAFLLLVLSGILLLLRFSSRANRTFALFLFLHGASILFVNLRRLSDDAFWSSLWFDLTPYLLLAEAPVLAYFFVCFTEPGTTRRRLVFAGAVLAAVGLEWAYLSNHCLVRCQATGAPATSLITAGPLYVLEYGAPLAAAIVGFLLIRSGATIPASSRRSCTLLVGVTLALTALLDAVLQAFALFVPALRAQVVAQYEPGPWLDAASYVRLAALVPALAALGLWVWHHGTPSDGRRRLWLGVLAGLAVSNALVISAFYALTPQDPAGWQPSSGTLLVGAWRILTPALIAYGLLKHRLFEFDPVLKATIGPTAIASVFLAVFFAASKVAENVLGNTYGAIGGGVTAGLLLFALSPLERLGQRIAHAVMPKTKAVRHMDRTEVERLYRDQASLVWSDGIMRPNERMLLDGLQRRLHIQPETAAALEHEAMEMTSRPHRARTHKPRRAASTVK